MLKSTSLSGLEQRIYFLASEAPHKIIDYETIKSWEITKKEILDVTLSHMCKKGWLSRLKKGLYLVSGPQGKIEDFYYLAQSVFEGYLGFSTALYLHGLTDEMPFTIYVVTCTISKEKELGAYLLRAVALKKRSFGIEHKNIYWISTVPKSIYDSLYIPAYSGGYPLILKAIHLAGMNEEQWKEFLSYIDKFESNAFCQKSGYLLELLKKTKTRVPNFMFDYLKKRIGTTVYLGKGKGTYNKKWKLIDCIGEKNLLSWWYGG